MPSTGYLARLAMRLTLLDLPSRMPRLQIVTRFDLNGRGTGQSETVPKGVPRRLDENKKTTTISRYRGRSSMAERQLPKLHTRVRFPSPAPTPNNFPKRSPLLIEIAGRIRIFAKNNVQHFVQHFVQHVHAHARFFDETKRHLALRTSSPDRVCASRSPWCCEALNQDSDRFRPRSSSCVTRR